MHTWLNFYLCVVDQAVCTGQLRSCLLCLAWLLPGCEARAVPYLDIAVTHVALVPNGEAAKCFILSLSCSDQVIEVKESPLLNLDEALFSLLLYVFMQLSFEKAMWCAADLWDVIKGLTEMGSPFFQGWLAVICSPDSQDLVTGIIQFIASCEVPILACLSVWVKEEGWWEGSSFPCSRYLLLSTEVERWDLASHAVLFNTVIHLLSKTLLAG